MAWDFRGLFRWCALALALCLGLPGQAAPAGRWQPLADTVFSHVTAEHGPPNFSTSLAQDRAGFIWVGAFGGLARWDGYRLRTYKADATMPGALSDGIVQALLADASGALWVGTNAHGLLRFDPLTERFTPMGTGADGIAHPSVLALAPGPHGAVWVGSDGGVDLLGADGRVSTRLRAGAGGLPEAHARALAAQDDGTLWIGTSAGLARRAAQDQRVKAVPLLKGEQPEVDAVVVANNGAVWVGTRGHGAFVVDPLTLAVHAIDDAGAGELPTESVYAIAQARADEIWLGTFGKGIVAVNSVTLAARRMRHEAALPTSLANDSVWALLRDRSGLMWAATAQGMSYTDPNQEGFLTLFGGADRGTPYLPDNDVLSVWEDDAQRVWLGLGSRGIAVLDQQGRTVQRVVPDPARPRDALPADRVTSILEHEGAVYVATVRGLYRTDAAARKVARIELPGADPALRVNTLARTPGALWVGARDLGLWRMDRNGARRIDGLGDERITALAAARDALWVGTRAGLNRVSLADGKVERIPAAESDLHGLPNGYVNSLLVDRAGRVWVGTLGGGVALLEGRGRDGKARFIRFGEAQGMPSMYVARLLEDAKGAIWASTDNGFARIDLMHLRAASFARGDGPGITNSWAGAGAATAAGDLLFGGLGGLTVIRPAALQAWRWQAPVVLSELAIGPLSLPAAGVVAARDRHPLELRPGARALSLEFAALDFSAPQRNRYSYQLVGADDGWTEVDAAHRTLSLNRLPPGDYTLRVRGTNREGVWSPMELTLPLHVLPAWYQAWWFRMLLVAALLTAVLMVMRLRTAALKRRQHILEAQVVERTAELREQQQALVAANARLETAADTLRRLGDIGRDITAHLDADAVFRALDAHLAALIEQARVQVYRIGPDGTPELCHGRADDAVDPALVARVIAQRAAAVAHRDAIYAPLLAGERLLGVLVVVAPGAHDFDERARLIVATLCAYVAIALVNAEARAQRVQEEKLASLSNLVAGMAHEVNTPLGVIVSAISGVAEALRALQKAAAAGKITRSALDASVSGALEFADLAMRNADRVTHLVNSFKSIVVADDEEPERELDLAQYLPQVSALLRQELEAAGHRLVIEVEPGLKVRVVVGALTEVLVRVLENARDHAFEAGARGTVTLRAERDPQGQVRMTIHDNGRGIPSAQLPRIFDPFFTTRPGAGGHTGLGLNVAFNHMTERLGGSLRIDSGPEGTTAELRF